MNRKIILFQALAVTFVVASLSAATQVTFVFKNGQRQSGTFSYNHDSNYNLIINGQEQKFPSDDIALIEFVPGRPPANEIAALSPDANPAEHQRHMLAFRDGRTLRGKIYDFQGDNILIDALGGSGTIERQTYPMSAVARLYVSAVASRDLFPTAARTVQAQPVLPNQALKQAQSQAQAQPGTVVRVDARSWNPTNIHVKRGDRLAFSTSDTIYIDARIVTGPEGTNSAGLQDLPVKTLPVGALIGRIGPTGTPFPIGGNTQPILMPADGNLLLGINDNNLKDNSGFFSVRIVRQ